LATPKKRTLANGLVQLLRQVVHAEIVARASRPCESKHTDEIFPRKDG
jgi:hypothetical protein